MSLRSCNSGGTSERTSERSARPRGVNVESTTTRSSVLGVRSPWRQVPKFISPTHGSARILAHVERTFYTGAVLTAQRQPPSTSLQTAMQTSLFGSAPIGCNQVRAKPMRLDDRSSVVFEPGWFNGSDTAFEVLRNEIPWQAMERPMYDRIVAVPRLICTVRPAELSNEHPLAIITAGVERALGSSFDSVGLNYYRTGEDSVAWHRDRIGRGRQRPATVALVSLGSPRTFSLRRCAPSPRAFYGPEASSISTPSTPATRFDWSLGDGDLLVMHGACQREWEHCVPKQRGVGARISLAFRCKEAGEGPRN